MEFKEVIKTHERMCRTYVYNKDCNGCGLVDYTESSCHDTPFLYPDEYENIILKWLKNNPVVTRKDAFLIKYPDRPWRKYLDSCGHVACDRFIPCNSCKWWDETYAED